MDICLSDPGVVRVDTSQADDFTVLIEEIGKKKLLEKLYGSDRTVLKVWGLSRTAVTFKERKIFTAGGLGKGMFFLLLTGIIATGVDFAIYTGQLATRQSEITTLIIEVEQAEVDFKASVRYIVRRTDDAIVSVIC